MTHRLATYHRGFHKVVGGKALSLFRPEELELLICGNPELDFEALEQKSKYEDGYERDDDVIKNLWEVSCPQTSDTCHGVRSPPLRLSIPSKIRVSDPG